MFESDELYVPLYSSYEYVSDSTYIIKSVFYFDMRSICIQDKIYFADFAECFNKHARNGVHLQTSTFSPNRIWSTIIIISIRTTDDLKFMVVTG